MVRVGGRLRVQRGAQDQIGSQNGIEARAAESQRVRPEQFVERSRELRGDSVYAREYSGTVIIKRRIEILLFN